MRTLQLAQFLGIIRFVSTTPRPPYQLLSNVGHPAGGGGLLCIGTWVGFYDGYSVERVGNGTHAVLSRPVLHLQLRSNTYGTYQRRLFHLDSLAHLSAEQDGVILHGFWFGEEGCQSHHHDLGPSLRERIKILRFPFFQMYPYTRYCTLRVTLYVSTRYGNHKPMAEGPVDNGQ